MPRRTKRFLNGMTDAELIAFLCEDDAETYVNAYSHDELIDELLRLGREGCLGYLSLTRGELEADILSRVDEEPDSDQAMLEHLTDWLARAREDQEEK